MTGFINLIPFFIFILSAGQIQSQHTATIYGNAKTYAGDSLHFYSYTDFLTKTKQNKAVAFVDSSGNFKFTIQANTITELHTDLNVFEGILFAAPDKSYKIALPQKTEKRKEDALNPYFKPQEFYISVLNADKNCINSNLKSYEKAYNKLLKNLFEGESKKVSSLRADSLFNNIEKHFALSDNEFLKTYITYDLVQLKFISYKRNKTKLFNEYFAEKPVYYQNSAYNKALIEIFGNYLFENKKHNLSSILKNKQSFSEIINDIQTKSNFKNPELAEYLLLINLYHKFYTENSAKNDIIKFLKKNCSNIKGASNKMICDNFIRKAEKLIIGNPAPDFILQDASGKQVSLNQFRGKFIYLNFCNADSYPCKKDLILLEAMQAQHIDLLEIVTIWSGKSLKEMKEFQTKNGFKRTFLFAGNSSVNQDYKVVSYPSYFMIHPEGTLLMMPAPEPGSDKFEPMYFYYYRDWKRELIRRQHKNPRDKSKSLIKE